MKRRKIYYLPGLISLIGLPILLIFMLPEEKERPVALKLFLPSDDNSATSTLRFSKYSIRSHMRHKKIEFIRMPVFYEQMEGLEEYRYWSEKAYVWDEMRLGNLKCDTNKVLKIDLTSDHSYGDFVWLVNAAAIHGYRRYAYIDNSFYFISNAPPVPVNSDMTISLPVEGWNSSKSMEPSQWQIFKRKLGWYTDEWFAIIKYYKTISMSFCILILFPFLVWVFNNWRCHLTTKMTSRG